MDMELREFVKQALVNIVGAVADAAEEVEKGGNGAAIAPLLNAASKEGVLWHVDSRAGGGYAFAVQFDLSVTVASSESQQNQIGGKLGLKVIGMSGGQNETDTSARTAVQRLQFVVPVRFQHQEPERPRIRSTVQTNW